MEHTLLIKKFIQNKKDTKVNSNRNNINIASNNYNNFNYFCINNN